MASTYHQFAITAWDRGREDEADDWTRKSLTIEEELGDAQALARTYGVLGALAEVRQQPRQALEWMIKSVNLFDEFPSPLTGLGPSNLARLTRDLGMPVLEEAWREVTSEPVPQSVLDYITNHHDES